MIRWWYPITRVIRQCYVITCVIRWWYPITRVIRQCYVITRVVVLYLVLCMANHGLLLAMLILEPIHFLGQSLLYQVAV